jgi:diguanylate cyclase (GGDEF)-like protein
VLEADSAVRAVLSICKDITVQKKLERDLKEMSIKDSLTGLYNVRHFYERLPAEIERSRRQQHPLSLHLFDIDQFKQYNDTRGHLDGDRALQAVGKVVSECTREHVDVGFRYGGDEFIVLLPETDARQAMRVAERIRHSFERCPFEGLTLSMGVVTYQREFSMKSFIQAADAMMYESKRAGGNRVSQYKPEAHSVA